MSISKSLNQRAGWKIKPQYLAYTLFKLGFFVASCIEIYNIVFGIKRSFTGLFERIASSNIFPFNLYPNIAEIELVIGVLLLPILLFYNDSKEDIAFSIRYKVIVIGLTLGIWLLPLALLEGFYRNPIVVDGLGYAGIHLLLNMAAIAGLIFSPILYVAGISSCFMIKGTDKELDEKPDEEYTKGTGVVINIDDLRRVHCKRPGLAEKIDT